MSELDTRFMDRRPPPECVLHADFSTKTVRDISNFGATPTIGSLLTFGVDGSGVSYCEATGANSAQNSVQFADNDRYSMVDGGDVPSSLSAWVYCDSFTTGDRICTILSKANTYSSSFEYQYIAGNGAGDVFGHPNAPMSRYAEGVAVKEIQAYVTAGNVTTGTWHHMAFTSDGTTANANGLKIYIDGVLVTTTKTRYGAYAGMTNGSGVLRLCSVSTGQVMDGKLAKVILFKSRILTAQEISEIYAQGAT